MNPKLYQTLLVVSSTVGTLTLAASLGASLGAIIAQHQAVVHHAAHFEPNSWGLTTFHWNDETAQVPFNEDNLVPTPLVLKNAK